MTAKSGAAQRKWFVLAGCMALVWFSALPAAAQNTIHVPADQATIQGAINAANAGDTVLVAPGTYIENINFQGKAITLMSSSGPTVTTINGGAKGTVVTFNHNENATSIIRGFTITNGFQNGYPGGGISVSSASPTIAGNVISGNRAAVGIGIYVNGGSPLISSNTITANNQNGAGDGGQGGGGILLSGGSGTTPQVIGNLISNNSVASGGDGGGISAWGSGGLIANNIIQGNTAYNFAGGIAVQAPNGLLVVQNLIVNNVVRAGSGGGGWISQPSGATVTFLNNTIVGNTASDSTSGIFTTGFAQTDTFTNNIVVAAHNQIAITCSSTYSPISPAFSYNDAYSDSGQNWAGVCAHGSGTGNISADPMFLTTSDYHLQWGSPAVDAGSNSAPNLPATDYVGNPRTVDGNGDGNAVVDMGAYELQPTTITLSPSNLTFAAQSIGSSSAPQIVTLTNTGSQILLFSISIGTGFAQSNNCGTSLAAGASCSISVTFAPTAKGTVSANLTLKDTAAGNPHQVALLGTGGAPKAALNASSLDFGSVPLGGTTGAQTVTLSNSGDDIMAISGISAGGDFAQTNTCGAAVAAGGNCSISVTFTATVMGPESGAINIADNAPGAPHQVSLTGTGAAAAMAPVITGQPVSQTVGIGQTATFFVGVSGQAPLSFQWKKNGVSIPGANSAIYTTPPATINDDGATYKVGIQNGYGGVTSNIVTLSVPHTSASIGTQPVSVTVSPGQSATFTVVGAGTAPLSYQWRKNNVSIAGATLVSYTTPPVTLADNGTQYVVSVQNSFSGATSNIVTLHVAGAASGPPTITTQPVSESVSIGQTATFIVVANGYGGTLTYQWKKNNISIPGATSGSYTTPPATINDDGATYKVGIQNNLGGVTSNVVTLSVPHSNASIITQPTDMTGYAGYTATFTVIGAGTGPLLYQWRKNNISISGATSSSYTTPTLALTDNGTKYVVSVQNSFSGVTSNIVTLHVIPPPPTYSVGVTVANLAGTGGGLVLQNNGSDSLSVNANGSFVFPTALLSGTPYNVTVRTQPSAPAQTCIVSGGAGTVTANVTGVTVDCFHNEWAWMGGSSTGNPLAVYGTLGVAAPGNTPGGRLSAVTLKDGNGDFWLFGGYGYDPYGNLLPENDLWKYSGGVWTWMGGSKTAGQNGVYGTMGTASASNMPGARLEAVGWTDASGNLWIFGGIGFDSIGNEAELNDLWKYSNGQWTWMGGSNLALQHGTYGTPEVPSVNNTPGGRYQPTTWTDSSGAFWLFGGTGYDASSPFVGELNDLWKYSGGQWTWISGSNTSNQSGIYGTQGVPAVGNIPGGRFSAAGWIDSSGALWLFGGTGFDSAGNSKILNDLWRYDGSQWTWMSGSNIGNQGAVYGTKGIPAATNSPGSRQLDIAWTDASGNFWLFGGNYAGNLNDLWRYSGGMWTWVSGSGTPYQDSAFGTQGVLSPNNIPSSRMMMMGWVDNQGRFWLFGGAEQTNPSSPVSRSNDLWMYQP
jgi:hypothetical protein